MDDQNVQFHREMWEQIREKLSFFVKDEDLRKATDLMVVLLETYVEKAYKNELMVADNRWKEAEGKNERTFEEGRLDLAKDIIRGYVHTLVEGDQVYKIIVTQKDE